MNMEKENKNILEVYPANTWVFEGPFNVMVTKEISLKNLSKKQVSFKVKTTSPRLFYVRPNIGLIDARGTLDIEIFMQPTTKSDVTSKQHRFLVQAIEVPDNVDLSTLWKTIKSRDVWSARIQCELVFKSEADAFSQIVAMEKPVSTIREFGGCEHNGVREHTRMETLAERVKVLEEEIKNTRQIQDIATSSKRGLRNPRYFYVIATFFTTIAACVGALVGKNYL